MFCWLCLLWLPVFLSCWVGRLFDSSDYGHVNGVNHGTSGFLLGRCQWDFGCIAMTHVKLSR